MADWKADKDGILRPKTPADYSFDGEAWRRTWVAKTTGNHRVAANAGDFDHLSAAESLELLERYEALVQKYEKILFEVNGRNAK